MLSPDLQAIYDVSIHAPREGCDLAYVSKVSDGVVVSIHAPREGCDLDEEHLPRGGAFQFTHPGRGATIEDGETQSHHDVSIHAPREGCDRACRSLRL